MATEKLISVDHYQKTLERFKEKLIEFGKVEAAEVVKTLIKGLKTIPAVDAVEVVRCKDYKHYMTIHCTCDGCCISDYWYCADGERKDNE